MTHRTARRTGYAALALSLGLTLTACSDDTPDDAMSSPAASEPAVEDSAAPSAEESAGSEGDSSDDGSEGSADDGGSDDSSGDGAEDGTGDDGASEAAGDPTTMALQAIATAQSDADGTAYAVDKDNVEDVWEVEVAIDKRSVEVVLDATGTEVLNSTEEDLDEEDRTALADAKVGLPEAIQRVVGENGGTLDDADLDVDDGVGSWNVSILTQDGAEADYLVSLADGKVTEDTDD